MSDVPPTAAWPYARSPTVDDLRVRSCFICRDEDVYIPGQRRTRQDHGFVHACRCTLVAHERCILEWMDSGDENRRHCAVCKAEYIVIGRPPPRIFSLIRAGEDVLNRAGQTVLWAGAAGVGLGATFGVFFVVLSYSAHASYWMLGSEMATYFLADRNGLPDYAMLMLPVVPLVFYDIARSSSGGLVHLLSWMSMLVPMRPFSPGDTDVTFGRSMQQLVWDWPPSPWLLTTLFPLFRHLYRLGLHTLTEHLLDESFVRRQRRADQTRGVHHFIFADLGVNLLDGGPALPQPDDLHAFAQPINLRAVGRTLLSMTVLPPLAAGVGSLLRGVALATGSRYLSAFVGLRPMGIHQRTMLGLQKRTGYRGIRLLTWGDFEPVWWRNILGLGIVIVARDLLKLAYEVLLQREDQERTVVDIPFTDIDTPSLDLIVV
ncbi:hypothetical protein EXIGLDRAFT_752348 [Exidia glandulosa HHB12029]|uniref:RING-CH-type domain-containing protein n=1 Tax=Exidia glandulosa HHB12029 TaxID=1314781 RepID=A0A165ZZQ4_EXIGL|nr:hypothetical protein EXIGLDRAFT_752348 [Exidia glandulosa HHB12029]